MLLPALALEYISGQPATFVGSKLKYYRARNAVTGRCLRVCVWCRERWRCWVLLGAARVVRAHERRSAPPAAQSCPLPHPTLKANRRPLLPPPHTHTHTHTRAPTRTAAVKVRLRGAAAFDMLQRLALVVLPSQNGFAGIPGRSLDAAGNLHFR
jgi:hypothetical protein